jgi:hypothetical protein
MSRNTILVQNVEFKHFWIYAKFNDIQNSWYLAVHSCVTGFLTIDSYLQQMNIWTNEILRASFLYTFLLQYVFTENI